MNLTFTTTTDPETDPATEALRLLTAGGLTFTEVRACPHPRCEVCRPASPAKAA